MSVITHLCGGTTSTSTVLKARVSGSSVRVLLSPFPAPLGPEVPDQHGLVTFEVNHLTPDTEYVGAYEIDGVVDATRIFRFRTFPREGRPASFRITACNCLGNGNATGYSEKRPESAIGTFSNTPALLHIRDKKPLFHMFTGDWGYYDYTETQDEYRDAWLANLSQPNQQALLDSTSLVYMYDDHDGPSNDSDRTNPAVPAMLANYREQMPCYPLQPSGPVYHSFMCGRVLFVISDGRAERDPNGDEDSPSKTMLGAAQKAWLINLLQTTDAPAIIWQTSSIWHSGGGDTWGSFSYERDEIAAAVEAYMARTGGIFIALNGDNHSMSMDDGSNNDWGGFPVFHFGALDAAPNHKGVWSYGYIQGYGNYGTIDVEDDGTGIAIIGTGWTNGDRWFSHREARPRGWAAPGLGVIGKAGRLVRMGGR